MKERMTWTDTGRSGVLRSRVGAGGGRRVRAVALAVCLTGPAAAQDVPFSPDATEACLLAAEDRSGQVACIGVSAVACLDGSGGSNAEYGLCFGAERVYWDGRVSSAYAALREHHELEDALMVELGAGAPPMAPALQEMQRTWSRFRDAVCTHEASLWGGGSGSGPAWAECMTQLTGEHALRLERNLEDLSDG